MSFQTYKLECCEIGIPSHPLTSIYFYVLSINLYLSRKIHVCLLAFLYMNYELYLYNYLLGLQPSMLAMKKIKIVY
jgi:hypothetical protein